MSAETEIEYQCGRCGSTMYFEDCGWCYQDEFGYGDPNCAACEGEGTVGFCISSADWCNTHPLPGRENTPRHTVESYEVPL